MEVASVNSEQLVADRFLSPLTNDERLDPIGPDSSSIGHVADAASVGRNQQKHHGFLTPGGRASRAALTRHDVNSALVYSTTNDGGNRCCRN